MNKTTTGYYFITDSNQIFFDKVSKFTLENIIKDIPDSYKGHIITKNYIKVLFDHSLVYECYDLIALEEKLKNSIHRELMKTA